MSCTLKRSKKDTSFWKVFEPHPGKTFTLREAIFGETETNQNKQGKNMKKHLDEGCPDGIDSSLQGRALGNDKPLSGLAWWRSLSDNQQMYIYMLIGTPTVAAILLGLIFHCHMWIVSH